MRTRAEAGLVVLPLLLLAACGTSAEDARQGFLTVEASVPVRTGADVLVSDSRNPLAGRRVGLIVNHTSRTANGHVIDALAAMPDVEITALFGPEHGIRGDADAGEVVGDARDPATGAPIYSLYGEHRAPTAAMLEHVDVLIFDMQDVGARFYTYISTMGLSMQAAAEHGVPFMVLDRPNPLGGLRVDGYVREPEFESFVGQFPIPVQHGLTIGELATMIRDEGWLPGVDSLDLTVVTMQGWERSMLWPGTGLDWIAPSPNLPTFDAALVYAGTCLVEATTASEGRGTDLPFLTIGAPWMDAPAVAEALRLPGLTVDTLDITPRSIPGASTHPKWQDEAIRAIRMEVTDASAVRPLEVGIRLLETMIHTAPDSTRASIIRSSGMARLSGTRRLEAALRAGASTEAIMAAWADEVRTFETLRRPYLLY